MTNSDLVEKFWNLFSEQKWNDAMSLLNDRVVVIWPKSREKMIGPKNFVDVNRHYPNILNISKLKNSAEKSATVDIKFIFQRLNKEWLG